MTDRRSATRLVVRERAIGGLRVLQDVEIERVGPEEITIVSGTPIPRGEHMRLEVLSADRMPRRVTVRAVECRALIGAARVQQRVRLQVVGQITDEYAGTRSRVGALVRRVPVRLLDISTSGCLFECPTSVDEGTVGFLDVTLEGRPHAEAIRVCRSTRLRALPWPCRLGAEFLMLAPPAPASLRHAFMIRLQKQLEHESPVGEDVPGLDGRESTDA